MLMEGTYRLYRIWGTSYILSDIFLKQIIPRSRSYGFCRFYGARLSHMASCSEFVSRGRWTIIFCGRCQSSANMTPLRTLWIRVRVTSQLAVRQSICLGVEPHLGLMSKCLLTVWQLQFCPVRVHCLRRGRICFFLILSLYQHVY
jgi:hypothetical protein